MGTHPIFESDFDCLTDIMMRAESVTSKNSRASTFRYRVKARTSNVDESLFGSPNKRGQQRPRDAAPKRETVQVVTKDLIRNVIVPSKDPSGNSIVLGRHNLNRIKSSSRVRSQSEIEDEAMRRQAEKEEKAAEVAERKQHFAELDMEKKTSEGLNDLETEAMKENEYLLEKARIAKIEQDDKIKKMNELINDAKVHAIRDMQVNEKEEIQNDVEDEDKRLDVIMEVHRLKGIKESERVEQEKMISRREGAREILKQIKLNTETHLLEEEKKNAEAQALVDYMEKLQEEDVAELMQRKMAQLALKEEVDHLNQQAQVQKELRAQQEKIQDLKAVEYNRLKAEREAAFEAQQAKVRKAKELEIQRLRSQQERAQDHQAERDALRAKRNQEQNEREWRRREKEEAEKRAQVALQMSRAREEQINHKLHFQAIQAQRERQEFQRILGGQEREIVKEKESKEKKLVELDNHARQLRAQIQNREQERIEERRQFYDESDKLAVEQQEQERKIQKVIDRKLDELRQAGIDEKYVAEVVRKLHRPQRLTNC